MNLGRLWEIGWTTTVAGEVSNEFIRDRNLLCVRGTVVDGIFINNVSGRKIVRIWNEKQAEISKEANKKSKK